MYNPFTKLFAEKETTAPTTPLKETATLLDSLYLSAVGGLPVNQEDELVQLPIDHRDELVEPRIESVRSAETGEQVR